MVMKLGRIPQFDTRSRQFSVSRVVADTLPMRTQIWECPLTLNQGELSACVGFSWCHYLASLPEPATGVTYNLAVDTYRLAQKLDKYPGENYDGTSILAGVKALQQEFPNAFDSYHWCFSLLELIMAIGYVGPVNLGVNWYNSMFDPGANGGVIKVAGVNVGGHAILAVGVNVEDETITLHNSWGVNWGYGGRCLIRFSDMERLLSERGEACVAVGKRSFDINTFTPPSPFLPPKRKPKHIGAG